MTASTTVGAVLLALVGCVGLPCPPSFEYIEAAGCGDLVLMAWNKESSEVLSITMSGILAIEREASFALGDSTNDIQVRIAVPVHGTAG